MKKTTPFIILFLLLSTLSFAQKKEKIKGNREVKILQKPVDPFHTIDLGESLEIFLVQGEVPMVEIEADHNLHEVVKTTVVNGILTIATTHRIGSKKEFKLRIYTTQELTHINLKQDAVLTSLNDLHLKDLNINVLEDSKLFLTTKTDNFKLISAQNAKIKLNLITTDAHLEVKESSDVEALINAYECKIDLYQRTNATIEGKADEFFLRIDNSARFIGKGFVAKNATLTAEGDTDTHINTKNKLKIEAIDKAKVYIHNNPSIDLEKFSGTATLYKKE